MPKVIEERKLYRAVMRTVGERGYAATTKQLAAAAGVNEVTLFRKYNSKLELVGQALDFIMDEIDFPAAIQHTGDHEADLLRIAMAYQASARDYGPFFAMLMAEVPSYPELSELLARPLAVIEQVAELLARYQADGVLRAEDPRQTALVLLSPLIYGEMVRRAAPARDMPPLDPAQHVRGFLEGRERSPAQL